MAEGRGERREVVNLRLGDTERRRIDQAAAASGASRTRFMLEAALARADAVLAERTQIGWDAAAMAAFRAVIDAPPAPAPRAVRAQPWKR